jgi:hypothetical protein
MNTGELLTRGAIWVALGFYLAGSITGRFARGRRELESRARWFWTLGCAAYVVHVICAFHFFHHWSHAAAYADTARQTAAVTGWNWGGGIYVNYAFTAAWLADVPCWWRGLEVQRARPRWVGAAWEGFFFFMVFNGAVVFARGPARWFGAALCVAWLAAWWRGRRASV